MGHTILLVHANKLQRMAFTLSNPAAGPFGPHSPQGLAEAPLPASRHPNARLANKLTITHNTVIFNNGFGFSRFYSKNPLINNDLAGVFDLVLKLVFQNNTVGKFFIVYG